MFGTPGREWWLRRHARTGVQEYEWRGNHLHIGTATYVHTDIDKFLTLAFVLVLYILGIDLSDTYCHSSGLSLSLNHPPFTMVTLIAMNIFNSLCVFGDTFTKQQHFITRCCTKALKIPLHRVMAAHACIDRPFMQSMGLHTRTQRMLGTPQFFRRTLELRTTRWRTRRDRDHHEEQHSPNAAVTALIRLWTANASVGCYMCQTLFAHAVQSRIAMPKSFPEVHIGPLLATGTFIRVSGHSLRSAGLDGQRLCWLLHVPAGFSPAA